MVLLVTPKGWTGPVEVDGHRVEGTWRSHQVPIAETRENPEHRQVLEQWLRSYRPEELFEPTGTPVPGVRALAPDGPRRMSANPHANGGLLRTPLRLPDFRTHAVEVPEPGGSIHEPTRVLGRYLVDVVRDNPTDFRLFGPDETASNRLDAVYEVTDKVFEGEIRDDRRAPRPVGAGDGDPLRAHLPGLARGLPAHRAARAVQLLRGVHPPDRLDVQPAREVAQDHPRALLAAADLEPELPAHLARVAPGPQRLLPPGPGLHRPRGQQEGRGRAGLPAAGHQHAALDHAALPGQPALRQRRRRRQAAGLRLARPPRRPTCTAPGASGSGTGPRTTTATPTW